MRKTGSLILLTMLVATVCAAQTSPRRKQTEAVQTSSIESERELDRILEKFVAAQGSPQALMRVRTRVMRGLIEIPNLGLNGSVSSFAKSPDKALIVFDVPGRPGQLLEGYDGQSGWAQTPLTGAISMSQETSEAMKRDIDAGRGRSIRSAFSKIALKGKTLLGGREAYAVEATPIGGRPEIMYFDARTGLMSRLDIIHRGEQDRNVPKSIIYEGYAKIEGVTIPTLLHQTYNDFELTIRIYEVKFNVQIEDALFKRPQGAIAAEPADSQN